MNIHQYPGDIFYASREFTDDEARDLLRFPCWVIVKSGDNIIKHIGYNKDGEKSFVKYGSGSNITKTSQLTNDGEDGEDKFSTVEQLVKKLDRPEWTGTESQFFVVSSRSAINLRPITVSPNQVPYWSGNTYFSSPIYVGSGINVGVAKSDPTERLDVNGNVRADNFRYNIQTANTVPLKDWTDGLKRSFTDRNGINHEYAFAEDLKDDSKKILKRYVHKSNREIYPTNVDFSTGYITASNHGFSHIGQKRIGLYINDLHKLLSTYETNLNEGLSDYTVIPGEWLRADCYVKVIDNNTLMLCNSSGVIIAVNSSSSENSNVNHTKWHIEDYSTLQFSDIPIGFKRLEIIIKGMMSPFSTGSTNRYITPILHRRGGGSTTGFRGSNGVSIIVGASQPYIVLVQPVVNGKQCLPFYNKIILDITDVVITREYIESVYNHSGGIVTKLNDNTIGTCTQSHGLAGIIVTNNNLGADNVWFSNNTIIEIYIK